MKTKSIKDDPIAQWYEEQARKARELAAKLEKETDPEKRKRLEDELERARYVGD